MSLFFRRLLLLSSRHLHHPIIISPSISTVQFLTSKPRLLPQTLNRSLFHATAFSPDADKQRVPAIKKNAPKPNKSKKPSSFMNANAKFPKQRKGRVKGISCRGDRVSFGRYGLRALEPGRITARAINAGRGAMARYARGGGKLWVRVIPDKSVTARPAEMRMGKGKGAIKCMVGVVKPGRILYEIGGVSEKAAREAIALAARKMPLPTQFVLST